MSFREKPLPGLADHHTVALTTWNTHAVRADYFHHSKGHDYGLLPVTAALLLREYEGSREQGRCARSYRLMTTHSERILMHACA